MISTEVVTLEKRTGQGTVQCQWRNIHAYSSVIPPSIQLNAHRENIPPCLLRNTVFLQRVKRKEVVFTSIFRQKRIFFCNRFDKDAFKFILSGMLAEVP